MASADQIAVEVASLHTPARVKIFGFERADTEVHMIEWIGRGKDFRQFVVSDIEAELYAQDQHAQLLSAECTDTPEFLTQARREKSDNSAIVTQVSIMFPVVLCVKAGDGAIWKLVVKHSYHATNLDLRSKFQLRQDFTIVDSSEEVASN